MATTHPMHDPSQMDQMYECNAELTTNDRFSACVSRQKERKENCGSIRSHMEKNCVLESLPGKIPGKEHSGSRQSHGMMKTETNVSVNEVDSSQISKLVTSLEKDIRLVVDTDGKAVRSLISVMDNSGAQSIVDCRGAKPAVNSTVSKSTVNRNIVKCDDQSKRGKSANGVGASKSAMVSRLVKSMKDDLETATNESSEPERMFAIEEIVELGDDCLGLRVVVQARGGSSYLGVINYVLPASRRLALEQVTNPQTGKKRVGLLTFFFHNVLGVAVVGEDHHARQRLLKDVYQEKQSGKQLLMKKIVPLHLQDSTFQTHDKRGEEERKSEPLPPPPPKVPRPSKWVVIDALDEAYNKAVCELNTETVICVNCVGQTLGRSGSLALLAAATPHHIFIFDLAKVGPEEMLRSGLGQVLMDEGVVKVMHDCRPLEDLLHHQFAINLANVFDTQASEVYVYMLNHRGCVPSFVTSLPVLLYRYLGIPYQHTSLSLHHQNDESVLFERPLPLAVCEGLACSVRYLRELRLALLDLMLVDLTQITNIYLASLRDKDSATVQSLESHVVPAEVQRLARRSVIGPLNSQLTFTRNSFKLFTTNNQ
ncbi:hypothetical protein Pcinc_030540 [Petrolisthes cinctipes]|uniref:3'-5' exonuclease domain-containing protein n=1 Tax=Petrolisthes cinctipes TaxID=88211 RepID=A0AAE1EY52_PETCI|nr:hypothetical protein Pcinc_030540 [Petrolisthes cinctipes]